MLGSSWVPALPGATNSLPQEGDWASLQASACSRPPEPMTSTFCLAVAVMVRAAGRAARPCPPACGRRRRCLAAASWQACSLRSAA